MSSETRGMNEILFAEETRRGFLKQAGSLTGGMWAARLAPLLPALQACATEAAEEGRAFEFFTPEEGVTFEAYSARIIPSDDSPGAREANVVYFADHALSTLMSQLEGIIRSGLEDVEARARAVDEAAGGFAGLSAVQQDEIIGAVEQENPGFFFFARVLTALGFVTDPRYGGNQNQVGWEHIGFDPSYTFQPTFGYYDRNEHGDVADGGDQ